MYRIITTLAVMCTASVAHATTIPGPNSIQYGMRVISGWKCRANGRLIVTYTNRKSYRLMH